ncbi:hypothetical protein [Erythrobacter sp. JK5]|uniref:hypothetical protein n=1 Tax=Erythrobacter sp. JK5 TaxID=2829500 RepID=UPI001BAD643B|nr:hypothetical protein [Erythrobacter sp. JK5]QUL36564.1 hypothetical protein KDC96_08930 [Erythrobacter sp. JK5]
MIDDAAMEAASEPVAEPHPAVPAWLTRMVGASATNTDLAFMVWVVMITAVLTAIFLPH